MTEDERTTLIDAVKPIFYERVIEGSREAINNGLDREPLESVIFSFVRKQMQDDYSLDVFIDYLILIVAENYSIMLEDIYDGIFDDIEKVQVRENCKLAKNIFLFKEIFERVVDPENDLYARLNADYRGT
ncbi:MAG: hypothetical protein ROR55_09520 [Devosia sp.]